MISERANDGIERSAEQWFRRANKKAPEKGGALKSRSMMSKEWLEQTREAWAQEANQALERAGRGERIDHHSLAAQRDEAHRNGDKERATQLNREPGVHLGAQVYDWSGEKHPDSTVKQRDADVDRYNRGVEREQGGIDGDIERTERWYGGIEKALHQVVSEIRDVAARIEAWRNPPQHERGWSGPDIGF